MGPTDAISVMPGLGTGGTEPARAGKTCVVQRHKTRSLAQGRDFHVLAIALRSQHPITLQIRAR